jgi:hypothetical protein
MSAGLGSPATRSLLLAGIHPSTVGRLKGSDTPREQLLLDLYTLNEIERLADGTVPLLTWLENAEAEANPRIEAGIFKAAQKEVAARNDTYPAILPPSAEASQQVRSAPVGATMVYLTQQQIHELIEAIIAAQIDYSTMRPALLAGIDFGWLSALPAVSGLSATAQLNTDLARLNGAGRLLDGTAPLEIWLRNAIQFTAGTEESKVFQRALDARIGTPPPVETPGPDPVFSRYLDSLNDLARIDDYGKGKIQAGRWAEAAAVYRKFVSLARAGPRKSWAYGLEQLGICLWNGGDQAAAKGYWRDSKSIRSQHAPGDLEEFRIRLVKYGMNLDDL